MLFWAVIRGNIEIVKLLVEKGAEINYIGPNGLTALDIALKMGHTAIAELLLNEKLKKSSEQSTTSAATSTDGTSDSSHTETSSTDGMPSSSKHTDAEGDKEKDDANPQCTNPNKQSAQFYSTELNTKSDLDEEVLHILSLIYCISVEEVKNAVEKGKISPEKKEEVEKALSSYLSPTVGPVQITTKGEIVCIKFPNGTSHFISREYLVADNKDEFEEDLSNEEPDPMSDLASSSSNKASPTKFDYENENLPQLQTTKPESLPPVPSICKEEGNGYALTTVSGGFFTSGGITGGIIYSEINITGENMPEKAYSS